MMDISAPGFEPSVVRGVLCCGALVWLFTAAFGNEDVPWPAYPLLASLVAIEYPLSLQLCRWASISSSSSLLPLFRLFCCCRVSRLDCFGISRSAWCPGKCKYIFKSYCHIFDPFYLLTEYIRDNKPVTNVEFGATVLVLLNCVEFSLKQKHFLCSYVVFEYFAILRHTIIWPFQRK